VATASSTIPVEPPREYVPRGPSVLTHLFHDNFQDFALSYDDLYAKDYGRFRLQRISRVVEKFEACGIYVGSPPSPVPRAFPDGFRCLLTQRSWTRL
jgi:hypothetical protein